MFKKWISVNNHFLILMLQSGKSLNIPFLSLSSILDCIKIIIGSLIIAPRFPPKIDYRTGTTGPKKPSKNLLLRLRFTSSTRSRSDRRRRLPHFSFSAKIHSSSSSGRYRHRSPKPQRIGFLSRPTSAMWSTPSSSGHSPFGVNDKTPISRGGNAS
jgi:hypothetical protein